MKRIILTSLLVLMAILIPFCILQLVDGHALKTLGYATLLETIKTYALYIIGMVFAFAMSIVTRFMGMVIGGKLSGLDFLSLRIFNIIIDKRNGHFSISDKDSKSGLLMGLPLGRDGHWSFFFYNTGHFFSQVLVAVVSIYLLYNYEMECFAWFFMLCCAIFAAFFVLMELLSLLCITRTSSLGELSLAFRLLSDIPCRERVKKVLHINHLLYYGNNYNEMPEELFEDIPLDYDSTPFDVDYRSAYICRLMANGQYDDIRLAVEKDCVSEENVIVDNKHKILRLYAEFLTLHRPEEIESICSEKFISYLDKSKSYDILYAYHLLCLGNEKAAKNDRQNMKKQCYYGDERLYVEFMNMIDDVYKKEGSMAEHFPTIVNTDTKKHHNILNIIIIIIGVIVAFYYHRQIEQEYEKIVSYQKSVSHYNDYSYTQDLISKMEKVVNTGDIDSLTNVLNEVDSFIIYFNETYKEEYTLSNFFYELRDECARRQSVLTIIEEHSQKDEK